jgi:hypothetical protein
MARRAWLASLFVAVAVTAACGSHPRMPAHPPASGAGWAYEIVADDNARELGVMATFPQGTEPTLSVDDQARRFLRDVEVSRGDGWAKVEPKDGVWRIDACGRGCSVRYRFLLEEAAHALDDVNLATKYDGAIESPPSSWLLRPTRFERGVPYRFHVQTADGVSFATGVTPGSAPDTYEADVVDLELAPYSVFGTLRVRSLDVDGVRFTIARLPGKLAMDDAALDRWITMSASAVASFYGHFPVRKALLILVPSNGDDVSGKTLASGGASILLDVGAAMKPARMNDDWVLTHEMTHLAFPSLARRYIWLEEGLATYVEPIARALVGTIPPEEVWRGLVRGLPNGQPAPGDRGLDHTPTWGRTYWGGALFCLMADIEIRKATQNRHSLEDALRGIVDAGGNGEVRWSLERALAEGDRAIGVHVLEEMHARWGDTPITVDLPRLWARLGVSAKDGKIAYDDSAPDAAIRRGIAGGEKSAQPNARAY